MTNETPFLINIQIPEWNTLRQKKFSLSNVPGGNEVMSTTNEALLLFSLTHTKTCSFEEHITTNEAFFLKRTHTHVFKDITQHTL